MLKALAFSVMAVKTRSSFPKLDILKVFVTGPEPARQDEVAQGQAKLGAERLG